MIIIKTYQSIWLWRMKIAFRLESPAKHYEELRNSYHMNLMQLIFAFGGLPQGVATFEKLCYDSIMGQEEAKKVIYALAGGLH